MRADYESVLPSAMACFEDDFEACIAHLRLPMTHRRSTRTTNLLECLFVEERRRLRLDLAKLHLLRSPLHLSAEQGEAMFRHACGMGLEGIVSKRLTSP